MLYVFLILIAQTAVSKTVSVQLIDDLGQPITGADVSVWFWSVRNSFEDEKKFKSDVDGHVDAHGETGVGYSINAQKIGHYRAKSEPYISPDEIVERTYVLPRMLNPSPLFASNQPGRNGSLKLTLQNVWLGYDFEAGDFVAPYGNGKVVDLRFKYRHEFKGYASKGRKLERSLEISKTLARRAGKRFSEEEFKLSAGKWDGVLEISFPREKEGLIEEVEQFWPYGELKLPHLAPESGYFPTRHYEANTYSPRKEDRDVGFYLRTRVKLNSHGEIVSANYAKVYGDFRFDPRGMVSFTYYFNPTPNDRNLEFDPKHNLFPADRPGANVHDP